jgi:hypothetical protein
LNRQQYETAVEKLQALQSMAAALVATLLDLRCREDFQEQWASVILSKFTGIQAVVVIDFEKY